MVSSCPAQRCGISEYTGRLARELQASRVRVERRSLDLRCGAARYLRDALSVARSMVITPPSTLHIQYTPTTSGPAVLALMWIARARGADVVLSAHERPSTYERRMTAPMRAVFRFWERALLAAAKDIIVFSEPHAHELRARFKRAASVLPLGVEPAAAPHNAADRRVVTVAGFMRPSKGIEDVIEAAPGIAARVPGGCAVRIVGACAARDAGYVDELRRATAAIPAVTIITDSPDDEYQRLLAETDVFVFPSRTVSQSVTFGAATALGAPCVVVEDAGLADAVRSYRAGLTYRGGDGAALADAVVRLLTDDRLAAECREGALRYADAASWPEIASRHLSVYTSAAA
jgi:glycosyltransferase involved in cell wall biosynthesis